jgi:hypothetical protein
MAQLAGGWKDCTSLLKSNIRNGVIWGQYMDVMAAIYTITASSHNEFYKPTLF